MKRRLDANAGKGRLMATVPAQDGLWNEQRSRIKRRTWLKAAAAVAVGGAGAWFMWGGEPVAETGAMQGAVVHHEALTAAEGVDGVALYRKLMAEAAKRLETVDTISAVFHKQERIDGKLQPLNVMEIRVRNKPLAIYGVWRTPDAGQQVIWRDGAHDGKMLVSPAGFKRRIMPIVKLLPDDPMAMAVSRRPVTNLGIWKFTERVAALLDEELLRDPAVSVKVTKGDESSGRPCTAFKFEHVKPSPTAHFKDVTVLFDEVLRVPVAIEYHRWDDKGIAGHLEESYLFENLTLNVAMNDADFDEANPALKFGTNK